MPHTDLVTVKRALISVSDKTGIVEFAQALHQQGVEILSTGGTYRLLCDNQIPAIEVSDYTGFPEMMDGRVKTLHPKIHGGILARRDIDGDVMQEHDINAIDMVVVNLYPFEATVARENCSLEDAVENIDIGGPAMVRSAAKNWKDVAVLTDASQYETVIAELKETGAVTAATKFALSVAAFNRISNYDAAISDYLSAYQPDTQSLQTFPSQSNARFVKLQDLRYGENPHQKAAFYVDANPTEASVATARQLQGKELSFNNIADTDAALECVKQFDQPACVIVKHANPCGVAVATDINLAYQLAFATDPESSFGGIIAFNRELDAATAEAICEKQFVEVIIAPSVSADAVAVVAAKKNVRLLECGTWGKTRPQDFDYKRVNGGLLIQDRDNGMVEEKDLKVVSTRVPSEAEMNDMMFAWKVAKMVKSNAIIYAKDNRTIGVGAGQMSRINSARIAGIKAEHAGLEVVGAVMASDAFFPFRDGIDNAAAAGISCVIQPGGSMRDDEVIAAANEHGMAMVFTGMRHFRH